MWIDTHCHLDAPEFAEDRADVLRRACANGVTQQILPAVSAETWPTLKEVCDCNQGLHAAYGLHPMYLDAHRKEHLAQLREWIEREKPVAVGECGLDFFVEGLDAAQQRHYFCAQMDMAHEFDLPVILHARRAVDEVIQTIKHARVKTGVIHSFSGSTEQAAQLFKLNFCLGIGGPVTYPRAKRLHELVRTMPAEFILLETDAPDQPLFGHQGIRNEPARLLEVAVAVAKLRDVSLDQLQAINRDNARRVFGI